MSLNIIVFFNSWSDMNVFLFIDFKWRGFLIVFMVGSHVIVVKVIVIFGENLIVKI